VPVLDKQLLQGMMKVSVSVSVMVASGIQTLNNRIITAFPIMNRRQDESAGADYAMP